MTAPLSKPLTAHIIETVPTSEWWVHWYERNLFPLYLLHVTPITP